MTRPYTTHLADSTKGTRVLMAWLQEVGGDDADPVGVAIDDEQIALAQGEQVYLIGLDDDGFFSRAALAAAIMGAAPPRLVAIDAEETLVRLANTLAPHYPLGEFFSRLAACMLGDLRACIHTADHPAPPRGLPLPDQAYTARLLEPQYQWECFVPETRILTVDLRWVPLGEIKVGDELLTCEEESPRFNQQRQWQTATVLHVQTSQAEVREYTCEDGTSFQATPDHPVLAYSPHSFNRTWRSLDIVDRHGGRLAKALSVWEDDDSWEAGWLAGLFDGEGHICAATPLPSTGKKRGRNTSNGWRIGIAQNRGATLRRIGAALALRQFHFRDITPRDRCARLQIQGGWGELLRLLGSIRPPRLLHKAASLFHERSQQCRTTPTRLVQSRPIGVRTVVDVTTSTGTFIAEGFVVHNCPKFYFAVSVPLARIRAEWRLFGLEAPADWWVSYSDLWLRSLLHYTGDPTLSWLFNSGEDPVMGLSRMFELGTETTRAVLVWHICGRSIDVMADTAPTLVDRLPDNLPEVGDLWNKRMPSLWLGITQLMGSYQRDRLARTLYGRKFRGGRHPGAASAFTILGTVQDLLEVAAVTFHNNRPSPAIMIKGVDSNPLSSVARVLGTGSRNTEEHEQWLNDLRPLATLAEPLAAIRLEATVVDGRPSQGAPAAESPTTVYNADIPGTIVEQNYTGANIAPISKRRKGNSSRRSRRLGLGQ